MGKAYGIKVWCYWEHLEGSIGNLMGTHWGQPKNHNPNLLKKNHSKEEDWAIVFSACPWVALA